ncbi:MAG TPA: hypothetical protein VKD23_09470 [Terriglobales bacterium]|nr:hypothetical protein [Terriglobales bacterium]
MFHFVLPFGKILFAKNEDDISGGPDLAAIDVMAKNFATKTSENDSMAHLPLRRGQGVLLPWAPRTYWNCSEENLRACYSQVK